MAAHVLKYYHVDHKSAWKCVAEKDIPAEAKYESVLYVKYRAEDVESSGEEQEYWGPFYIDIDVRDDNEVSAIREALADITEIIGYLKKAFGIKDSDYRVYASGGKGFHFELNPYLYMDSKFRPMLPLRYRAMVNQIKEMLPEVSIDMGVYSQGKGRQWRRVNVQRENGNYKNWLPQGVANITASQIVEMCKTPGPEVPKFEKVEQNALLKSWFESTKNLASKITVSEPVQKELLVRVDTPECVINLAKNVGVKSKVNSNLIAMQLLSFGIAKGWTIDQIISYNSKFIQEYKSSQYRSPAALEDHIRGLYDYALERPDKFQFGCKMMLSCVDGVDCNSCQVTLDEGEQGHGNVYIKDGGYWIIPENMEQPHRQLTNFLISWEKAITKEDGSEVMILKFSCNVSPKSPRLVEATAESFLSSSNFKKLTNMYEGYYGSDKEATMLKLALAHLSTPVDMTEVGYTGLVWLKDEWHYTTKEGSYSLNNTLDLVKTRVDITTANNTRLNFDEEEPTSEEIIETLTTLFSVNIPEIITPMALWFFNAFFNPHTQFTNETSPSLFVTGLHGSGKTQTMIQLHRLFAPSKPAFPSISATTAFSMNKYASSTNIMPLIFDEFKPSANKGRNNEVGQVSQAIRSSYNKAFESRGTQAREIDQTPFYAPLAIIGEQQLNEGAIADRIILVQMDKSTHTEANANRLEELKLLPVEKIGALFLEFCMKVTPREYTDLVLKKDKKLEKRFNSSMMDSRPRRNLANLEATLSFLAEYIRLYAPNRKLVNQLRANWETYLDTFEEEANAVYNELRRMDDIAAALNQLNDLADLRDTSLGDLQLMPNRHYIVKDGVLYFDVYACYRSLNGYKTKFAIDIYLTDSTSFIAQLSHKDYIAVKASKSDVIVPGKPRVVIGIDMIKAADQGIVLDSFKVD